MSRVNKSLVRTLIRRGNSLCVVIPYQLAQKLALNTDDAMAFSAVQGSLVITKVQMPKVPDLRAAGRSEHLTE